MKDTIQRNSQIKNDYKFIQYPLFLHQDFLDDVKKTMQNILAFGVYMKSLNNETGNVDIEIGMKYFNLELDYHEKLDYKVIGSTIKDTLDARTKEPQPSISLNMLLEFMREDKTQFEVICLSAYLGCKSIMGKKSYCPTNCKHVLARIMGYSSYHKISNELEPHTLKLFRKYIDLNGNVKKYMFRKLFEELESDWRLRKVSASGYRGIVLGKKDKCSYNQMKNYIKDIKDRKADRKKRCKIEKIE